VLCLGGQSFGQGFLVGGGGNKEFPFAGCDAGTAKLIWDTGASGGATATGCSGTNVNQAQANFTATQFLEISFYLPVGVVNMSAVFIASSASSSSTGTIALTAACTAVDGTATDDPAYATFWAPAQFTTPGTVNRSFSVTGGGIALPSSCTGGNKWMHLKMTYTAGTATSINANTLYLGY
jgi:hypothetical protein